MPELVVPGLVENPFRELFRGLIVTSMLRSVEEQEALHRDRNRRRRASRCERAAAELGAVVAGTPAKAAVAPSPSVAVAAPVVPATEVEVAPAPAITAAAARLQPPEPVAVAESVVEPERPGPEGTFVVPVIVAETWAGPGVRRAAAAVWTLVLVALVVNTVVLGFDSWATGAADLALITLTLVWFAAAAVGDAGSSSRSVGSQHVE